MADGSLLVNFDVAPGVLPAVPSRLPHVKGGRWKDRFKAKKQAQHRARKSLDQGSPSTGSRPTSNNDNGNDSSNGQAARPDPELQIESRTHWQRDLKRKRPSDDDGVVKSNGRHSRAGGSGPHHQKQQKQPQVIISSLFSSNPDPDDATGKLEEDGLAPAAPTNAPLEDGSAFSNLGLALALSSHLSIKMNLKAPTAIQQAVVPQLIASDSDAFIQAETGSGKTLAYLLPLIHRMTFSSTRNPEEKLHRESGCFAMILAPTRELGRQIHFVLNQVLSHPSLHWIVPILLLGGEKKKSEKARLRKGGNILVATPGRLADHLQNTKSLDVGKVRWVILDEGDRLMDLGFEATIRTILDLLDERSSIAASKNGLVREPALVPKRRVTILCSATMQGNVQRLGEISLSEALFLKADHQTDGSPKGTDENKANAGEFSAPAQLQQSYVVTPAKLRLVTLAAILKRSFARQSQTIKVVVFFCCGDSVDFHFSALSARVHEDSADEEAPRTPSSEIDAAGTEDAGTADTKEGRFSKELSLDSNVQIHKLHGSLKQSIRTATMASFLHGKGSAVLLCTDIAARGLDLPNVDLVVQYDPPFSKEDYLHRIGRTARAGRDGRAMLFLMPGSEERYATEVLKNMKISRKSAPDLLKLGFGAQDATRQTGSNAAGKWAKAPSLSHADSDFLPMTSGEAWAAEATRYHLDLERWVLAEAENLALARRGFQSCVGAYATHVASERSIFDLKALHLGHVAKSFCLRDRPADVKLKSVNPDASQEPTNRSKRAITGDRLKKRADKTSVSESLNDEEAQDNARRMRAKMKEHMTAISEFNIGWKKT